MKRRIIFILTVVNILCFTFPSWGGNTTYYYSKLTANVNPTGAGKVYISESTDQPSNDQYAETYTTSTIKHEKDGKRYFFAQPATGYAFEGWYNANNSRVSQANPYTVTLPTSSQDENAPTQVSFTAKFVASAVEVESSNPLYGSANIGKLPNQVGDQVTLSAATLSLGSKFIGWRKAGTDEILSTERNWTITITEPVKYIAVFENPVAEGGAYYRISTKLQNRVSNPADGYVYLVGTGYTTVFRDQPGRWVGAYLGNSIVYRPLLTNKYDSVPSNEYEFSPAVVMKVSADPQAGNRVSQNTNIIAQGLQSVNVMTNAGFDNMFADWENQGSADDIQVRLWVNFSGQRYLMPRKIGNTDYITQPGEGMIVKGGWDSRSLFLEPLTEETMDKYYMGAKPILHSGEKYYTTYYADYPFKCYDGMKAYTVDSVNLEKGEVRIVEIPGGLVPGRTAVLLEGNGPTPRDNRLVPQRQDVPALTGTNLLRGVMDVRENDSTLSAYRTAFDPAKMRVLSRTGLSFSNVDNSTTEMGYVRNNTAYLAFADGTVLPDTLRIVTEFSPDPQLLGVNEALMNTEVTEATPLILKDDSLHTVWATATKLYAKTNNDALARQVKPDDARDYMPLAGFAPAANYDQSSWLEVSLATPAESDEAARMEYVGHTLRNVIGHFANKELRQFITTTNPTAGDEVGTYQPNTYIPASMLGTQQGADGRNYFFIQPQHNEFVQVTWAVWDSEAQRFITPSSQGTVNRYGLQGSFAVDLGMNTGYVAGSLQSIDQLQGGSVYSFRAIAKRDVTTVAAAASRRAPGATSGYTLYPLDLTEATTTGVVAPNTEVRVERIIYYDTVGRSSDVPFAGLNLVVTHYSDGSVTTTKQWR